MLLPSAVCNSINIPRQLDPFGVPSFKNPPQLRPQIETRWFFNAAETHLLNSLQHPTHVFSHVLVAAEPSWHVWVCQFSSQIPKWTRVTPGGGARRLLLRSCLLRGNWPGRNTSHEKLHFGVGRRLAPCKTTLLCRRVVLPLKLECYRCGGCRSLCSSNEQGWRSKSLSVGPCTHSYVCIHALVIWEEWGMLETQKVGRNAVVSLTWRLFVFLVLSQCSSSSLQRGAT